MQFEVKQRFNRKRNEKFFVYDIRFNLVAEYNSIEEVAEFCGNHENTIRAYLDKKNRVGSAYQYYVKTQKINLIRNNEQNDTL